MATTGYSSSQMASAELHLERREDWRFVRINGERYAILPSGRSNHTYTVRADGRGCSCRWYTETLRECSHMLAMTIANDEEAGAAMLATEVEINAFMADSAPAFRREESARRRLITSSPFFEDAPAAVKVRQIPTHGARCQTDMDAQAALDEIMRQSRRAAVLDAMGDDGQDALDAAVAARKVG